LDIWEDDMTEKLKDIISKKASEGKLVFLAMDDMLAEANIDDFVNQPLDGLLYDLNRLPEVIMTFIDDPKWVNDYAVYLVIKKLKEFYDQHKD